MSKSPVILPAWDTTEVNSVSPDQEHKDEGWLAPAGLPEKPPLETFNFWQNLVYKWIDQINTKGILQYDNGVDYVADFSFATGSDGGLYHCLTNNGPSSSPVDPVGDVTGAWFRPFTRRDSIFTSSGTWTKDPGLKYIDVELVGGGAGGGGVDGQGSGTWGAGSGGGAGGYSRKAIGAGALGATETVTRGAGGAGAAAGNLNGVAGGTTLFGNHLQASGGGVGDGDLASNTVDLTTGGEGGLGSDGDLNSKGGQGGTKLGIAAGATNSGYGGMSFFGAGGFSVGSPLNGVGAQSPGAGGSGGAIQNSTDNKTGGAGANGIIIVHEFY